MTKNNNAQFEELGRIQITDHTQIVVSKVVKEEVTVGYSINKHVESENFKGFTKGVMVPAEYLEKFMDILRPEEV